MMYGASVPEIATLGAAPMGTGAFEGAPAEFTHGFREELRRMIFPSDNRAATTAAQRTGLARIATWLRPEPMRNHAHAASAWGKGRDGVLTPAWACSRAARPRTRDSRSTFTVETFAPVALERRLRTSSWRSMISPERASGEAWT